MYKKFALVSQETIFNLPEEKRGITFPPVIHSNYSVKENGLEGLRVMAEEVLDSVINEDFSFYKSDGGDLEFEEWKEKWVEERFVDTVPAIEQSIDFFGNKGCERIGFEIASAILKGPALKRKVTVCACSL